ncbi:hypothetical protein [Streptomyces sp. NPDC060035]|uniref:hypothetical protein n=1 Tax=Streptomyces sp. NPDC060035 TaxID=3347044 RepID=UPI00367C9998
MNGWLGAVRICSPGPSSTTSPPSGTAMRAAGAAEHDAGAVPSPDQCGEQVQQGAPGDRVESRGDLVAHQHPDRGAPGAVVGDEPVDPQHLRAGAPGGSRARSS